MIVLILIKAQETTLIDFNMPWNMTFCSHLQRSQNGTKDRIYFILRTYIVDVIDFLPSYSVRFNLRKCSAYLIVTKLVKLTSTICLLSFLGVY